MFTPSFDKVISTVVGLGVPGLILVLMIGGAGGIAAGASAITAALAAFGPGGMVGGIITLPIAVLILKGISEYGIEKILVAALKEMKKKGHTADELKEKIDKYPVSEELKIKLKKAIDEFFDNGNITSIN